MHQHLYTVRPFSKPSRTDLKDVFRAHLAPAALLLHKLGAGDVCLISTPEKPPIQAIAWPAPEKIQDTIVQLSKPFQCLHDLKLGEKVSIASRSDPIDEARVIELSEVTESYNDEQGSLGQSQLVYWEWFLDYPLGRAEILAPGMIFEDVQTKGQKRTFRVEKINESRAPNVLYRFSNPASISVCQSPKSDGELPSTTNESLFITQEGIGGLSSQLDQLNDRLEKYTTSLKHVSYPSYYRPRRGGILLHGPSGVGKTLLLSKIAQGKWTSVQHLSTNRLRQSGSKADQAVSKVFAEALRRQPSVVIIDRLETLARRSDRYEKADEVNITTSLCEELDRLYDSRVLVIGATTNLGDVDESVRRPGHFELEIELPVPDARCRTEILKILSGLPRDSPNADLEAVGESTHGYVGADLAKLLHRAVDEAEKRILADLPYYTSIALNGASSESIEPQPCTNPTLADFHSAQASIRPTAMSQVFLETPKVKYSDIGGNHAVKRALHQAISWPLLYASKMQRIGNTPQKALLLYGPPGCSKTLIAQAVATESSLNFLAVKGAELVSMYVGESERAIREVFRKAKAASPSVLFFDEIDAIAESRPSGSGASSKGGLNILTTLLNELDGIEALKGVFVLAATNCPWTLDAALLRPGRFGKLLYVGPPDREARAEILKIRLRKMDVADDVDVKKLAEWTEGHSGAEVVEMCETAADEALKEELETDVEVKVGWRHFEEGVVQKTITPEIEKRFEEFGRRGSGRGPKKGWTDHS